MQEAIEIVEKKAAGRERVNGNADATRSAIRLELRATDPEVVAELGRIPEGAERDRFALAALRVGVLALRTASGQVDAGAIREAGGKLLGDIREALCSHAGTLTGEIKLALQGYFDPITGLVPQRIQALVRKDGELERMFRAHLGPDDSMLAGVLAEKLGENSPLFRLLSPSEKNGLMGVLEATIGAALKEQRDAIVAEFSLNREDSALSRLVAQIVGKNEKFVGDLKGRVETAVGEFSLDRPDSALSRLVDKVSEAQQTIAAQFSTDNEASAINHLSKLLHDTSDKIDANLTLDNKDSALSRVRGEFMRGIETLTDKNERFHADVRAALVEMRTRKEERQRSTLHGATFEDQLGQVLATEAQHIGDVCERTGSKPGKIQYCKKGDYVIVLGQESQAPGAKVAWEAKEDRSFGIKEALDEIEIARKNRDAQLGVFVFSHRVAPTGLESFFRHGHDLLVVWDPDDPTSDVFVRAAYSVARALTIRLSDESEQTEESADEIDRATRTIEKQLKYLDEFKRYGDNVRRDGDKICDRAEKMKADITDEIVRLDRQVAALKTSGKH
jgi:hypothetical protein